VDREHTMHDGAIVHRVICPNAANHAPGRGDHAILYPPSGSGSGWIHCVRTACHSVTDWLACFTAEELRAAGIRTAKVTRTFFDEDTSGRVRLANELEATDGGRLPYLRVSNGTSAWAALWVAAGVAHPEDMDPSGDLGGAVGELKGKTLRLELSGDGRSVRRILKSEPREDAPGCTDHTRVTPEDHGDHRHL
jgi:hypothetical protein